MLVILSQSAQLVGQDRQLNTLIASIKEVQDRYKIPAIGLGIVRDGEIIYQGAHGVESALPDDANSYFRMGSITKTFISLGLLALEEEGKLNLDMPVTYLASEIRLENPWADTAPVTLRHLLEHTSGLYDMSFHEIFTPEGRLVTAKEGLDLTTSAHVVKWKPGSYFSYSNPGYLIAGYILEKYAGMTFEEYLEKYILPDHNMHDSYFNEDVIPEHKRPIGYVYDGNWVPYPNRTLINRWSGSMVSTPADMCNFMISLLSDSTELDIPLKEMARPTTSIAAQNQIEIGYALGMETFTMFGRRYIGNRGGGYNLSTRFRVLADEKSGFFLAFNTPSGPYVREIEQLLLKFIANSNIEKAPKSMSIPKQLASEISGTYQLRSHRQKFLQPFERLSMGFDLTVSNDTIYRRSRIGRYSPLLMHDNTTFFSPDASTAHVLIDKEDGSWTFRETNLNGQYFVKVNKVWARLRFFGVFGAVGIILLSIPVLVIRITRHLIRSGKKVKRTILLSLLLGVLPLSMLLITTQLDLAEFDKLGAPNFSTVLFFLASILYPLVLLASLWLQCTSLKTANRWSKPFSILLYIAHLAFFAFLIFNGYIGMRLWAL